MRKIKIQTKTGAYYFFNKPFIRFTADYLNNPNSKIHPHIIVAKKGKKYISVGVTHSPIVRGKTTDELPDNIERSFVIDSGIYVRDKNEYTCNKSINRYHVSDRDKDVAKDIVKNAIKIYK